MTTSNDSDANGGDASGNGVENARASLAGTGGTGTNVLRIDASARNEGSQTRALADALLRRLRDIGRADRVVTRDVSSGFAPVDAAWIAANLTDAGARTAAQEERLALSETLVEELFAADTLVIGVPVYNFGIPASLKSWVDLIARARRTFRYTERGPEGLLGGREAYLLVGSGGTEVGGDIDFATPYLRHVLGFVGIDRVTVIAADRAGARGEEAMASALAEIDRIGDAGAEGGAEDGAAGSAAGRDETATGRAA